MSVAQVRGGIPDVRREATSVAGQKFKLPFYTSGIIARNTGANLVRLYFTEVDFVALNTKYVELPIASAIFPYGEWSGPVEADDLWIHSTVGASSIELVVFQRRG